MLTRFLRALRSSLSQSRRSAKRAQTTSLEQLERRIVLYATSGSAWVKPELVTVSFMPDNTDLGGPKSDLVSKLNTKFGSAATWQNQILKAAQTWARQTNLNFAVVPDNGMAAGSGNYQQGDPGFGDIRIGGYNFNSSTLATAYLPPQANNYSIAGDVTLNTGLTWNIGTTYDVYTVALHEFGHALGLYHSTLSTASMYASYNGVDTALGSDDISGIRNIYSANVARKADAFDLIAANETSKAATNVTTSIDATTKTAVLNNLDITTTADVDFIKFTAPAGASSTMTVQVRSSGLSLLAPAAWVYNASLVQLATAKGTGMQGSTLTMTVSGIVAGKTYYLKVDGADATAFGTGRYAVTLNMGTGANPAIPLPNTQVANGATKTGGGGIATRISDEVLVNQSVLGQQSLDSGSARSMAMDSQGNFVVTWSNTSQAGDSVEIFARRFDVNGMPLGDEFLVNTTVAGPQTHASIAMSRSGAFVITWTDNGFVRGQLYDAQGNRAGSEFNVNASTTLSEKNSMPAMAADGSFVVVWESTDSSGVSDIRGRRYDAAGNPVGIEFLVNTYTTGNQTFPSVAMNDNGQFVVTWMSSGQDGSGSGIYGQRYDAAGNKVGAEFRANTTTASDQSLPSVDIAADGRFVMTWASSLQDGTDWGIFAQRFDVNGVKAGPEFQVNSYTASAQNYPVVSMDSIGNFVITWSSSGQDGSGWGAYGQQYSASGAPVAAEILIPTTSTLNQKFPTVSMNDAGQMAVNWCGNGAADANGVYVQRYQLTLPALTAPVSHDFDPNGHDHDDDHGSTHQAHSGGKNGKASVTVAVATDPRTRHSESRAADRSGRPTASRDRKTQTGQRDAAGLVSGADRITEKSAISRTGRLAVAKSSTADSLTRRASKSSEVRTSASSLPASRSSDLDQALDQLLSEGLI